MARIWIVKAATGEQLEVDQSVFTAGYFPGWVYSRDVTPSAPSNLPVYLTQDQLTTAIGDTSNEVGLALRAALAPLLTPTAAKASAYTAAVGELAVMNVPAGGNALALPTAPADKAQVGFRAVGATAAVPLVVTRGGSDTIGDSGATSVSLPLSGEVTVYQYQATGSRWLPVANVKPLAALNTAFESVATPTLRRRQLPTAADALSITGEVPTITTSTSATTITNNSYVTPQRVGGVTGAAWDLAGDPHFLVGGTPSMPANGASPNNRVRSPQVGGTNTQAARYVPTLNFYTDAPLFEYYGAWPGSTFDHRLVVDGKLSVADGSIAVTGGSGSVKFDFGTAKTRHIALTVNDPDFIQINLPPTYSVWRPAQGFLRRLVAIGDSITRGTNVQPTQPWMWDLGRLLGCDDVWNAGIGGTSWTATDGSQFGGNRLAEIAPLLQPNDVVVFFGSRNDPSGTGPQLAAVQAAVTAALGQVAAVKNVFVATNMTVINTLAASVIAGAAAAGRPGIDASGWITGTGTVAATNGSGNSDRYISSDTVHPILAGYKYLARRWDSAVKALLPA